MSQRSRPQGTAPWPGRSHIATFVRALHLLDLDLVADWPGVTEQTFSTKTAQQNLQQRVKCVEWTLYRLLELYDAAGTRNKLRPFFPPTTPLQSLNLRAALYRYLTDLKKNGVLGREIVLRKTMLDECKGEKFEEVVAAVAMLVLRTVVSKRGTANTRLVNAGRLSTDQQSQLLPVVLAYRSSLQTTLQTRRALQQSADSDLQLLQEREADLKSRQLAIGQSMARLDPSASDEVKQVVEQAWTGQRFWAQAVLTGRLPSASDGFDPTSTDQMLESNTGELLALPARPKSLSDELDERLRVHENRLSQWTAAYKSLSAVQLSSNAGAARQMEQKTEPLQPRFTKHKSLNLGAVPESATSDRALPAEYQNLLESMRQKLSSVPQRDRRFKTAHTLEQTKPTRDPSSRLRHEDVGHPNMPQLEEALSTSDVAVTISALQHTKHISEETYTKIGDVVASVLKQPEKQEANSECSWRGPEREHSPTLQSAEEYQVEDIPHMPRELVDGQLEANVTHPGPSPTQLVPTPIELAGVPQQSTTVLETPEPLKQQEPVVTSSQSLLERTRQSMSLLSQPPPGSRPRRPASVRASQIFPVNPFETPARAGGEKRNSSPPSASSTPRDQLFQQKADYASVFKSRPKIAMSPTLSPNKSTFELDSILESGLDGVSTSSGQGSS